MNKDIRGFLRMFMAKGDVVNRQTLLPVVRRLHLAFKGKDTAEVYGVLIEQLLRAIRKYDPGI